MGSYKLVTKAALSLLLYLFLSNSVICNEGKYESKEKICERCECKNLDANNYVVDGLKVDNTKSYYELDCSKRNFSYLLSGWPENMGQNQTGIEIVYNLSFNHIKSVQQIPQTDATLIFICQHCKISEIVPEAFLDTPHLIRLDLSWNKITADDLHPDIFRGRHNDVEYEVIKLEKLDLSHNLINNLEKNQFEHTPYIRYLDLSNNPFGEIDGRTALAFGSLHKLEVLKLSHVDIVELPSTIFQTMPLLSEIYLNGNKFMKVPESLALVGKSLQFLTLNNNPIETIDDESFLSFDKLQILNITEMSVLHEIKDGSFRNVPQLEVLICKQNKKLNIFSMKDLRGLQHLKQLDISYNALRILDFGNTLVESNDTELMKKNNVSAAYAADLDKYKNQFKNLQFLRLEGNPFHCDCTLLKVIELFDVKAEYFRDNLEKDKAVCKTPKDLSGKLVYSLLEDYECSFEHRKIPKIPIYEPPQFLRPRSIMMTVFLVVACVVVGVIVGFLIVIIKRKLKNNSENIPVRYTTVRNSTGPLVNYDHNNN